MHDARDTGRTRAETSPNPSRHGMLSAAASALVAGAAIATAAHGAPVAAPGAAGDDAEIVRLSDEIMALHAESNRLSEIEEGLPDWKTRERFAEEHIRPLTNRHHELMPQLAAMAAATMAGFQAKARIVQEFNNCAPGYADLDHPDAMAWSLANDLLGVASVWRTDEDREAMDEDLADAIAAREAREEAMTAEIHRRTDVETMTRAELEAGIPGILEMRATADRLYQRMIERLEGDAV